MPAVIQNIRRTATAHLAYILLPANQPGQAL